MWQKINTALITLYFVLMIRKLIKEDDGLSIAPITQQEQDFLAPYLERYGDEFVEKVKLVRNRLSEIRGLPVSIQEALDWLKERVELDPVLEV